MKQIIAIFLFIFALASCKPECSCADCQAKCQTEQVIDSTAVETPVDVTPGTETEVTEEAETAETK
jgi:hypothetical protein